MKISDFGRAVFDIFATPFRYMAGHRNEVEKKVDDASTPRFSVEPASEVTSNPLKGRFSTTLANLPIVRHIIQIFSALFGQESPEETLPESERKASDQSFPSNPPEVPVSRDETPALSNIEPVNRTPELQFEQVPDEEVNGMVEQLIPDNGSCLFDAVRQQIGGLMTYLKANKLMSDFEDRLPDTQQLRMKAVQYMRDNYYRDPNMKSLIDMGLADFNEKRIQKLPEEVLNLTLLFDEIPHAYKTKHFLEIRMIMTEIIEGNLEGLDNLTRAIHLYKEDLKSNGDAETKGLVQTLETNLNDAKPITLETYLKSYENKYFFANRDALYALSHILHVDFQIYQHYIPRGAQLPGKEILLKAGDPRAFAYSASVDDPELNEILAPKAYLVFRHPNHYNVLVNP